MERANSSTSPTPIAYDAWTGGRGLNLGALPSALGKVARLSGAPKQDSKVAE